MQPQDISDILGGTTERGIHIAAFAPGRNANENFVVLSKPIWRNGMSLGIARLRFPVSELLAFWSNVNLGPGSTMGLIRSDGWLVARYPPPDRPVDLSNNVLFTIHLKAADHRVYPTQSQIDSVHRSIAFRRVPNSQLVATVGADENYVSQPLQRYFLSLSAFLAGLLAIVTLVTIWTSKLLAEDEKRKVQLADSLAQTTLLLGEIHHRVKNNLQAVASLVQLQPMDPQAKLDMRLRIAAMAAVHEQTYRLE